jgi:hypothetical protein
VAVCHRKQRPDGEVDTQTRTFSTRTADLLALSGGLMACEVTHVAVESTGQFWKPVYNILEAAFAAECLLLVNASRVKNVPG